MQHCICLAYHYNLWLINWLHLSNNARAVTHPYLKAIDKEQGTSSSKPVKRTAMALNDGPGMKSLQEMLNNIFETAIAAAYPDLPEAPVVIMPSSNYKFGDYQCNSAMSMAQVSDQVWLKALFVMKVFAGSQSPRHQIVSEGDCKENLWQCAEQQTYWKDGHSWCWISQHQSQEGVLPGWTETSVARGCQTASAGTETQGSLRLFLPQYCQGDARWSLEVCNDPEFARWKSNNDFLKVNYYWWEHLPIAGIPRSRCRPSEPRWWLGNPVWNAHCSLRGQIPQF